MAPRQRVVSVQSSSSSSGANFDESSESSTGVEKKGIPQGNLSTAGNQAEADLAREKHDYFNLYALGVIIVSIALNYDYDITTLSTTYNGEYFWFMWTATIAYFVVDFLWVAIVPICVKSPGTILKHHVVTLLYCLGPPNYPEYRVFMGYALSVEINTWFLILRRVVFKAEKPVSPMVEKTVSGMFYLTWIWIRCVVYPLLLLQFLELAKEKVENSGTILHLEISFIPVHAVLCILNFKWTYDLFTPFVKRWIGKGPKSIGVSDGL